MEYVRRFDPTALDDSQFDYVVLADMESCLIVGCRAPGAVAGPRRHVHAGDQLYYVLDGRMDVEMNGEHHEVGADSVVFIPEGTPHSNSYPGPFEMHLDIIVPPPSTMSSGVSSPAKPGMTGGPGTGFVRAAKDSPSREVLPGFHTHPLADRAVGSDHISVRVNEVHVGSVKLPWHIHDFDQFYFVLDGELELDIAHKHYTVPPMHLVVLPAGVPHRNWNGGSVTERHLALLVPHPALDRPADIGVDFSLNGSSF